MAQYEIEVKSLLGAHEAAERLRMKMREVDPASKKVAENRQLNHYFHGGDVVALRDATRELFRDNTPRESLAHIVEKGNSFSVRTRQKDDAVLLVVKASVDEGTSENTVSRLEFEEAAPVSLDELDRLVQRAGFDYQAKWSREREEHVCRDVNVCIDKNAGYGYLAEFEKVVGDESLVPTARLELDALMNELGVEELKQDRLERMFAHYNAHWPEYYGTDKTFVIE
jgi:adenylate cyclase class IV